MMLCDKCANDQCNHEINPNEIVVTCGAFKPPVTNADHIRAMGDEELAALLFNRLNVDAEQIPFCKGGAECETLLDTEAGIADEKCQACMLRWLQEPWEGW